MNVAEVLKKEHIALGLSAASKPLSLVGTICIKVFNGRIRDAFAVFHRLLKKMAVCKYSSFHQNGSDDARLAFLYCLCDVGHIALHLLVDLGCHEAIELVR